MHNNNNNKKLWFDLYHTFYFGTSKNIEDKERCFEEEGGGYYTTAQIKMQNNYLGGRFDYIRLQILLHWCRKMDEEE